MIKRIAIAAAAGATVFTVALASAAALDIDQAAGQVGSAELEGDANGVIVESYGFEFDARDGNPKNASYYVSLSDIDESIFGKEILIEAYTDGQDSAIAKTGKVVVTKSKQNFDWKAEKPMPKLEDIDSITIAVD